MTEQQAKTMTNATASEDENVSDIQSLILRAERLSHSADWWNTAMVWALVFAALAAVTVVVTTRMALFRTKESADAQDLVTKAKEAKLILDLKEKDLKIAEAGGRASTAETKAEGFRLDIARANERAAALELEAAKLRKELVFQGPRANLIVGEHRQSLVNALKTFVKQRVDVRHSASVIMVNSRIVQVTPIGDDVVDLSHTLISVFTEAGWNSPSVMPSNRQGHGIFVSISSKASGQTKAAAESLATALRSIFPAGVDTSVGPENLMKRPSDDPIQPLFDGDTIVVDVLGHP